MATKWTPDFTMLMRRKHGKKSWKLEFFRATKFSTSHWEADANLFRLRANRKWCGKTNGHPMDFTYVSIEEAMPHIEKTIQQALK